MRGAGVERGGGAAHSGGRRGAGFGGAAAAFVFAAVCAEVAAFVFFVARRNGALAYPLDDVFIHLSIAKHLAIDGVYGVTKDAFAAASSSLAWPWLLAACVRVFGDHLSTPLFLSTLAAGGLLRTMARWLANAGAKARTILWTLAATALLAPLGTLAMLGMEHTAHAWATIALLGAGAAAATRDASAAEDAGAKRGGARKLVTLSMLAALAFAATALRYESLGFVAIVIASILLRKRSKGLAACFALALGAVLPPLAFAIFAHAHGAPPVPTSVLLKAHGGGGAFGVLHVLLDNLREAPHLGCWMVLLVAARTHLGKRTEHREEAATLEIVFAATLMQLAFGRVGWFYRYEAYLVIAAIYALGRTFVARPITLTPIFALAALVLLVLPIRRAAVAQGTTVSAADNVFDQQMHMAAFLQTYFPHDLVAVNDIGAVSYLRDGPLIDLLGLADPEVARARNFAIDHALSKEDVTRLTAGAKVAIVYDEWFTGAIPDKWTKVATWSIANNRVCAFPSVAVYAADPAAVDAVRSAIRGVE